MERKIQILNHQNFSNQNKVLEIDQFFDVLVLSKQVEADKEQCGQLTEDYKLFSSRYED